jgi:hypothetical protein
MVEVRGGLMVRLLVGCLFPYVQMSHTARALEVRVAMSAASISKEGREWKVTYVHGGDSRMWGEMNAISPTRRKCSCPIGAQSSMPEELRQAERRAVHVRIVW